MAMLTTSDLLRRVPIFSGLTASQMSHLSKTVVKQRFKRGELIIEQGRISGALFIILSGRARVIMSDRCAKEVILNTLGQGDYVGEMSLIDGKAHSASVKTEVQTDVLVLSHAEFVRCLAENQTIAVWIMKGLVQRLRQSSDKVISLALMDVYGRVAKVLMDAAQPRGDQGLLICDKMTRQDIAKMVGASREMVSRVMRDFEDQGFINPQEDGSIELNERRLIPR
ncbi:Crp/Fnr family transcriptional regulator [Rhodoferax antarcticus]|uniref:Crp/Fnr family transcriptional regulator n=1 Tax=Rhodoferax antarcticus TaxID=81479 RepID=UPI0022247D12|nr:Crp/Fnr family transcriptional regulator [Rhodoferax antarcticus]MCW2311548.1 CRP-like cAMP-binding protein [Rhodoferax antarcticus]